MAPRITATVLCIDDQETGVAVRKIFLETFGYRVLTACSGRAGLEMATADAVDAVVLDYRMPDMDGEQVARELRAQKPEVPILMLTGYGHALPDSARETVDQVILKGGPPTDLLDALKRVLGGSPEKPEPKTVRGHLADVREQVKKVRAVTEQVRADSDARKQVHRSADRQKRADEKRKRG